MTESYSHPPLSSNTLQRIRKNTLQFFSGTILSRFSGYLRDIAMASCFGADPLIAIFLVGFRTSNLPRRLFGEGPLQSILITCYQNAQSSSPSGGLRKMLQLRADCHKTWSLSLLVFIALTMLCLALLDFTGERFNWFSARHALIISYTGLMLPGLWFICMSALNDAFLKSQKRFLIGSCAPIAFNLAWIFISMQLRDLSTEQAAIWLSLGVGWAYITQWLVTYIGLRQETWNQPVQGVFFSDNVKKLIKPLLQGIVGVGATQINGLMDSFFAIEAEAAGPTYLWFALRIEQAPLALIGLAISSAGLPALSQAVESKNYREALHIFSFSQKRMLTYMLGACSGMMCLAFIGVRLALERGDFTPFDTYRTMQCLWGYSLGLMGQGIIFLYQNLAFSLHQYSLVTRSSLYAMVINGVLNFVCVAILHLSSPCIAFTTTLATFVQLLILKKGLEHRYEEFKQQVPWLYVAKTLVLYSVNFAACSALFCHLYQISMLAFLSGQAIPAKACTQQNLIVFAATGSLWLLCHYMVGYALALPLPGSQRIQTWIRKGTST